MKKDREKLIGFSKSRKQFTLSNYKVGVVRKIQKVRKSSFLLQILILNLSCFSDHGLKSMPLICLLTAKLLSSMDSKVAKWIVTL